MPANGRWDLIRRLKVNVRMSSMMCIWVLECTRMAAQVLPNVFVKSTIALTMQDVRIEGLGMS